MARPRAREGRRHGGRAARRTAAPSPREAPEAAVPHRHRRRRHVHRPGRPWTMRGGSTLAKSASTPADPSDRRDRRPRPCSPRSSASTRATLARQTERIVHGTTVATNALLERKGARVGLLTTEGHRDVIEMREGLKDDRYNLRMPPPVPLVPRARRLGVRERMRSDGTRGDAARPPLARAGRSRPLATARGRGGRGLLPPRLPRPRATRRRRARRSPARCPASTCRSPPRCSRRSRSTSGSAPRSSTPTSGPALSRYLRAWRERLQRRRATPGRC